MEEEVVDKQLEINQGGKKARMEKVAPLLPYCWKKGQSGNPAGRPRGKTMKEYAKELLACQTEEERQEFLHAIPKTDIWKMAEGNPESKVEVETIETPYDNLTVKQRKDRLQRAIEELGETEEQTGLDIPNGGNPGLPEVGQNTQGGGDIPKVCTGECKEGSDIITEVTPENNRDNSVVGNPAVDKQPEPQDIPN